MSKHRSPSPQDLQQAMIADAERKVADHAAKAATFVGAGNDPAMNGDLILVGRTPMGIMEVAIRLTMPQIHAICSQVTGGLASAMQQQGADGPTRT